LARTIEGFGARFGTVSFPSEEASLRILIDADVLLDFALGRDPFADAASALLDALQQRPGTACMAWHTASNFYYLTASAETGRVAREFLAELIEFVEIAPTTTASLTEAIRFPMPDFEDAMQVAAARAFGADLIATRNTKDFSASPIPAALPSIALLRLLEAK
jgi:predicted nucleic acid-binding protein